MLEVTGASQFLYRCSRGASNDSGQAYIAVEYDGDQLIERNVGTGQSNFTIQITDVPQQEFFARPLQYMGTSGFYVSFGMHDLGYFDLATRTLLRTITAPTSYHFKGLLSVPGVTQAHAVLDGLSHSASTLWLDFEGP